MSADTKETTIKFTDEQLEDLKKLNQTYQAVQAELGALDVRQLILSRELDAIEERRLELEETYVQNTVNEKTMVEALTAQYGPGTLNPETGEFTPSPKSVEQKTA